MLKKCFLKLKLKEYQCLKPQNKVKANLDSVKNLLKTY